MQCCNSEMNDFSYHRFDLVEKVPHFYCPKCGKRYHKDRTYTTDEWFFYINEETYADYLQRQKEAELAADQDRLESLHVHELINHSDPEK